MLLSLRSITACCFALVFSVSTLLVANAQNSKSDSGVSVTINFGQLKATKLGSELINFVKSKVQEEAGEEMKWEDINKSIGFDPFEEIESIVLTTQSIESPEDSGVLSVKLKSTSGNLEGLVLATPGYESTQHNKHTIHSADLNGKRLYATVTDQAGGAKTIHVSLNQSNINSVLDSSSARTALSTSPADSSSLIALNLGSFPAEKLGEGPHQNILKLIQKLSANLSESEQNFNLAVNLSIVDEQRAEQIRQVAQGLVGMLALATSMDTEDEDFVMFNDCIKSLDASREGKNVAVTLVLDGQKIFDVVSKEFK